MDLLPGETRKYFSANENDFRVEIAFSGDVTMSRSLIALAAVLACAHALPDTKAPIEAVGKAADGSARQLQAHGAAAPAPPKPKSVSIWSIAKRFFTSREKAKTKVASHGANATIPTMTPQYAMGFKTMVSWWCKNATNKEKALCQLSAQGKATGDALKKPPSLDESREAVKAYCAEKTHQSKLVCIQWRIKAAVVKSVGSKAAAAKSAGSKSKATDTKTGEL